MSSQDEFRQVMLASRTIEKTKKDLEDILAELVELHYLLNNSGFYDVDVIAKEKTLESKVAILLLYLDSMGNLAKDLERETQG